MYFTSNGTQALIDAFVIPNLYLHSFIHVNNHIINEPMNRTQALIDAFVIPDLYFTLITINYVIKTM